MIYFVSVSFEKMSFQTALFRITKSLYGSGYYLDWVQLWFLPHLFVVSLYAYAFLFVMSRSTNRWLRWGILLATLAISIPLLKTFYPFPFQVFGKDYELYGLPFSLDLVFLSGFSLFWEAKSGRSLRKPRSATQSCWPEQGSFYF